MRLRSVWLLCWSSCVSSMIAGGCAEDGPSGLSAAGAGGDRSVGAEGGAGGTGTGVGGSAGAAGPTAGADQAAGAPTSGAGGSADAAGGSNAECPVIREAVAIGELDPVLDEASGLAVSARNPGVFYTHNDSSPLLYAIDRTGAVVARLELAGALANDWEDVAIGPGPDAGVSYVYIGDIGDNDSSRTPGISVLRAPEPEIDAGERGQSLALGFDTLYFRYPDAAHNAESLFVDPDSGDLYVVTKSDVDGSEVFAVRAPHTTNAVRTLERVAGVAFGSPELPGSALATGAAIAPDGRRVLIRTYDSAFLWARAAHASVAEALSGVPCALSVPEERQGEAISFALDGASFYTTSEGSGAALFEVELE